MNLRHILLATLFLFAIPAALTHADDGLRLLPVTLLQQVNSWLKAQYFAGTVGFLDSGVQTLNNGIATEASAQLIDLGINDPRFPYAAANAGNPGGFMRLDGRTGQCFFTFWKKAAGAAAGANAASQIACLDASGLTLLGTSALTVPKVSAAPTTAPGAGNVEVFATAGTNPGTCKLQIMAGTSTTTTTIQDNVGGGC